MWQRVRAGPYKERYVAHIGPEHLGSVLESWFDVSGRQIDVSLKESSKLLTATTTAT